MYGSPPYVDRLQTVDLVNHSTPRARKFQYGCCELLRRVTGLCSFKIPQSHLLLSLCRVPAKKCVHYNISGGGTVSHPCWTIGNFFSLTALVSALTIETYKKTYTAN